MFVPLDSVSLEVELDVFPTSRVMQLGSIDGIRTRLSAAHP